MKELIDAVKKLAEEELQRGNEMYGKHTSRHQAYAVLLEEVEEVQKELTYVEYSLDSTWESIKKDDERLSKLNKLLDYACNLASEAIQVTAMVQKFIDYEIEKEK